MRNKVTTVKALSLWHNGGTHDKLYRLELVQSGDKFDVFCNYGRRGGPLTMHIWAEGKTFDEAARIFHRLKAQKLAKGYAEINEDVMDVRKTVPTRR